MSFLFIPGIDNNFVLDSATTLSASAAADSNFPLSNLQNPAQSKMFRFAAAGTNDTLVADLGSTRAVTFCSVHFHNIVPGDITLTLQSDDNSGFSSPTTRKTFTVTDPSFWGTFALGTLERYWRLLFTGTPTDPIYVGKWVLGTTQQLTKNQLNGWSMRWQMDQSRPAPGVIVNQSLHARRVLDVRFANTDSTEVYDMLVLGKWGAEPIVVVPDDAAADVLWARATGSWGYQNTKLSSSTNLYEYDLALEEEPFPTITT